MEQEVTIIDVLKAFEPTGFSSGATLILGLLAVVFIVSLFSLFGYMLTNLILPIRRRADELEALITDLETNFPERVLSKDTWDNEITPKIETLVLNDVTFKCSSIKGIPLKCFFQVPVALTQRVKC